MNGNSPGPKSAAPPRPVTDHLQPTQTLSSVPAPNHNPPPPFVPPSNQNPVSTYVPAPGVVNSQDLQQQWPNKPPLSSDTLRLTCKQCQNQFSSKPEVFQFKVQLPKKSKSDRIGGWILAVLIFRTTTQLQMWCCFLYSFRQYWLVHYFVKLFFVVFKNIVKKRFLFFRVMRGCSVLDYVAIHIRGKAMWKLCANTAKWRKWSKTLSHMKSSRDLSAVKVCETSLLDSVVLHGAPTHDMWKNNCISWPKIKSWLFNLLVCLRVWIGKLWQHFMTVWERIIKLWL